MIVSVEISYYPLTEDFNTPITTFLQQLTNSGLTVETGTMSTLITGEYAAVMQLLTSAMGTLMDRYPSVFNIKLSNSCVV